MERFVISDSDIEHLHNTVELVLDIIKEMSPDTNVIKKEKNHDKKGIFLLNRF